VPALLFAHDQLDAALRLFLPDAFPLASATDLVNRRLVELTDRVVVGSAFAAAEFARIGAGARVRIVPLGVDPACFSPVRRAS
jgi:alpha-1,6-mannosyltransferase